MAEGAKGRRETSSRAGSSRMGSTGAASRAAASRTAASAAASRDGAARASDHDAIDRLTDELLPSLIAKLGASGLGEIEVREGTWHVRLRGLGDGARGRGRADRGADRADRAGRAHPGHDGHGHAPAAVESHRPADPIARQGDGPVAESHRATATSPAVGVFQPRAGMTSGTKVRAGDRLGHVDMLGVPQEVVAPVDGIVGASLVEPGEAVEYGQELIRIELVAPAPVRPAPVGVPVSVGPETSA